MKGRLDVAPASHVKRRASTRTRAGLKAKNDDSDKMDFDGNDLVIPKESPLSLQNSPRSSFRVKVLKAVEVPHKLSGKQETTHRRATTLSPKNISTSSSSSHREMSNDYDTPATSVAVTPAESLIDTTGKRSFTRHLPLRKTSSQLAFDSPIDHLKGKGKRIVLNDSLEADRRMAEELQAEEYGESLPVTVTTSQRKANVVDTDEDETSLTEPPSHIDSDFPSEDESIVHDRRAVKKIKTGATSSLPTRKARDNARTSIAQKASLGIMDSEDENEESEYLSEADSDVLSDADTLDSIMNGDDIGSAAAVTAASNTLPAASAPAARRRIQNPSRRNRNSRWEGRATRERKKLEEAHPEITTIWEDLEAIPRIIPHQADQPININRTLKSFQLEGLDWMQKQESSKWRGGLLGDEMGMGKTIQAVSLIMSDFPAKDPTLIVVPPVALMQWQNEINDYTDGKLKILIHHNTNPAVKKLTLKQLKSYNVIMISYSGLESLHRKESKGWKRDDGLVKENSKIHAIKYHRLILDEAHNIKTRTTSVAKACFALQADYKWCLSGTPVQNRIGEFFSLLRFLRIIPFACYFCKDCSCAELHWNQDAHKKCTHCQHSGFSHVSIFNQELLNPITQSEDPVLRKAALGKLRLLTDRIMLRRMKRDHTASMELPPKEVIIHKEFFGEIERDFSSSIMSNTSRTFDTYVSRGVMLNNYANIFGLIMRMRQVANHPDLILKRHAERGQNVLVCSICDETAEEPIRSKCHHEFCRKCAKDYVATCDGSSEPDCPRCHIMLAIDFDQPDIEQDEEHVKKNSIINRIKMEDWTSSTKIEMLIYDLYKLRSKKQVHKSIVFSQFTSMLQLVEWRLHRAGFNTVMLDGSMSPAQRQKSIEYFMKNTEVEVFLVSLKAGGVALNLTEASRVFIIDPWWNPAAEWQSADRCHRIGQKRPCVITRLCIEDSVESRIVMLQEKKANMINGTINNDQVAMEKLTPEDMQFLFRGS